MSRADSEAAPDDRGAFRRIALVGNPNVGKSVIFGALTGTYATVSNYPGTTVEVTRAPAYFAPDIEIIDTPGVNSLTPHSEDERVTRDILLEGVDVVVLVADARNLARALVLAGQIGEADIPFVFVANMMDEAADRGLSLDTARLERELGVPVVPTVAVRGLGLSELRPALARARLSPYRVRYAQGIDEAVAEIAPDLGDFHAGSRWLALMCLAGDHTMQRWLSGRLQAPRLKHIENVHRALAARSGGRAGYRIARARSAMAEKLARSVTINTNGPAPTRPTTGSTTRLMAFAGLISCLLLFTGDTGLVATLDAPVVRTLLWLGILLPIAAGARRAEVRASFGRWAALPGPGLAVLFVVLYLMYRFVGVFAAGSAVDFLENVVFGTYINPAVSAIIDGAIALTGGQGSPVAQLVRDFLVGPYGVITVALTYAIAIILPIVTAFFLAFSTLEDSGYLPRLAIMVNRAFRAMGLNGKAVLPMILGLGCDTMATLTARIMETRKERLLVTMLLALGVPCSAQLGVILGLFTALPIWAPLVWGGVVGGTLFAVGFLAARLLPGDRSDLILELPPIRRPHLRNIVIKTVGRLEWYLKEAVPIFVLGTTVLFALDSVGLLERIVHASEPAVVGLLNLPPRAAEAFLVGFFRRDYGSAGIYALFQQGLMSPVQTVVALVTITLFVPCIANLFVIVKEQGARIAILMTAFIFPFAFIVGASVNVVLRAAGLG